MKKFALLLILCAAPAWADPPKVEPEKIEVEARELFQFSVAAEKGKKLVAGKLPADKFVVFPLADGSFVGQSRKGVQGTFVLQFWHAGDTVKLPDAAPLPALPVATLTVVVGEPEPKPKPPTPDKDVIPTDVLRVLIVEESAERSTLPAGVLTSMFAVSVRDAVKSYGGDIRIIDKDEDLARDNAFYRAAAERAKGKPLPYVVIGNGKTQWEGAVPGGYQAMIDAIKKVGG